MILFEIKTTTTTKRNESSICLLLFSSKSFYANKTERFAASPPISFGPKRSRPADTRPTSFHESRVAPVRRLYSARSCRIRWPSCRRWRPTICNRACRANSSTGTDRDGPARIVRRRGGKCWTRMCRRDGRLLTRSRCRRECSRSPISSIDSTGRSL